jgi:hypothetical protein
MEKMDFEVLKKRQRFFEIWKQRGSPGSLEDSDRWIARAMEELALYHGLWETGDVFQALNFKSKMDPFLHVTIRSIILRQLGEKSPPEVEQAYLHLQKKELSRQGILDSLGLVLADQMREMLAKRQVFDEEKYRERLRGFLKG